MYQHPGYTEPTHRCSRISRAQQACLLSRSSRCSGPHHPDAHAKSLRLMTTPSHPDKGWIRLTPSPSSRRRGSVPSLCIIAIVSYSPRVVQWFAAGPTHFFAFHPSADCRRVRAIEGSPRESSHGLNTSDCSHTSGKDQGTDPVVGQQGRPLNSRARDTSLIPRPVRLR